MANNHLTLLQLLTIIKRNTNTVSGAGRCNEAEDLYPARLAIADSTEKQAALDFLKKEKEDGKESVGVILLTEASFKQLS